MEVIEWVTQHWIAVVIWLVILLIVAWIFQIVIWHTILSKYKRLAEISETDYHLFATAAADQVKTTATKLKRWVTDTRHVGLIPDIARVLGINENLVRNRLNVIRLSELVNLLTAFEPLLEDRAIGDDAVHLHDSCMQLNASRQVALKAVNDFNHKRRVVDGKPAGFVILRVFPPLRLQEKDI